MKIFFSLVALLLVSIGYGQSHLALTKDGEKLKEYYLSLDVENNWLSGHHVVWDTGKPDMPGSIHGNKTHCSAFAAAACERAGIYLLCPPAHSQILLANAQYDWLTSDDGLKYGWHEVTGNDRYAKCQQLANDGQIVIAVYQNTNRRLPGHIALIMPQARSKILLDNEGPELIMAGTHNHNYITLRNGFHSHIQSWPENDIRFFAEEKKPLF